MPELSEVDRSDAQIEPVSKKVGFQQDLEILYEFSRELRMTMEEFDIEPLDLVGSSGLDRSYVSTLRRLDKNGKGVTAINAIKLIRGLSSLARVRFITKIFGITDKDLHEYLQYNLNKYRRL